MAANLAAMLRSLLKARQAASMTELRFLREVARSLGTGSTNVSRASLKSAPMKGGRRRTLKCPRCQRRFARPVHLGRHLSATHGVKKKKAA